MRKLVVIAILFIAVGVVGSILTYNSSEVALAEEREVDATDVSNIDINMDNGRVNIMPAEGNQAKIELQGSVSKRKEPDFMMDVTGGTLTIEMKEDRKLFQFMSFGSSSATLDVYLPTKEYESLIVDTDNGAFYAEGFSASDIQAYTDNGRIMMNGVLSDTTHVRTANGKISLDEVDGNITGKSSNGEITVVTKDLDRSMDLETNNGRITVQTEVEPTNAIIDAQTGNGRITVFGATNWDTVIGNGDNEIKLRTDNGSITIEK